MQFLFRRGDAIERPPNHLEEALAAWQKVRNKKPSRDLQPLWSEGLITKLKELASLCDRICGKNSNIVGSRLRQIAAAQKGDFVTEFQQLSLDVIPFSDGYLQAHKWKTVYLVLAYAALEDVITKGTTKHRLAELKEIYPQRSGGNQVIGEEGYLVEILRTLIQPRLLAGEKNLINEINEECRVQLGRLEMVEEEALASDDIDDISTLAGLSISEESHYASLNHTPPGLVHDPLATPTSPSTEVESRELPQRSVIGKADNDSGYGGSVPSSRMPSISSTQGSKTSEALTERSGLTPMCPPVRPSLRRLEARRVGRRARLNPSIGTDDPARVRERASSQLPSLGPFSPSRKTCERSRRRLYTREDGLHGLCSIMPPTTAERTVGHCHTSNLSAATVATGSTLQNSGASSRRDKIARIINW
jgi:hypothetical protein